MAYNPSMFLACLSTLPFAPTELLFFNLIREMLQIYVHLGQNSIFFNFNLIPRPFQLEKGLYP